MIKSNRFESEIGPANPLTRGEKRKKKETRARTYKGEEMRRREAIIDPARVKRKEARGISRGEERRKEEDVQGMVSVAASLAAGSPQRFVHYKDYTFGVVFSVN